LKKIGVLLSLVTIFALPQLAIAKDPFEGLPSNLPLCYMVNSRGVLVNLDHLCTGNNGTSINTTSESRSIPTSSQKTSPSQGFLVGSACPKGTIDRRGDGTLCTAPCPTDSTFDSASLTCQQKPVYLLDNPPSNTSGYSGNCQYSWQTAADGTRCGGRAAN